ncbi:glycosyltransferase [Colwelliaceae bacterium MEBiC 14330]
MKKVLMIALELPPCRSAGVQRTLRFMEYLPSFGWQPLVITATENIYLNRDDNQEIPASATGHLVRAKCFDASKKLSFRGKYFHWMTLPDRYWPWYFDAIKQASQLIEKYQPDVIWSTYPVLSAHMIARKLHKKYNIPWVADYRDPLQCHYDASAKQYSIVKKWLERSVIKRASNVVLTTDSSVDLYRRIYSAQSQAKFSCIENGFYSEQAKLYDVKSIARKAKFNLLYSGVLYPNGRDPKPLFEALSSLKRQGNISADNFILNFRGTENNFNKEITKFGIADLINFLPAVSFAQALEEMSQASANILIQDEVFNRQIPGKIFDYISARRPVLALTPDNSATKTVIDKFSFGFAAYTIAEIEKMIVKLMTTDIDCSEDISQFSRQNKTAELAEVFDKLIGK